MSNLLFPEMPGLEWDVAWYPVFKTAIQAAVSGKEYRASLMANPLYTFELNYEFLRQGARRELAQLVGFFLARRGSYDNFLYRFLDDCAVTDQLIAVGDGATASFQLRRSFGESVEPVQNVDQIKNVKVAGVEQRLGLDYTVSATGMLTFAAPPAGQPITWTGSYFYRARFAADTQEFDRFMKDLWSAQTLTLTATLGTRI